jgi:hypothetical protein
MPHRHMHHVLETDLVDGEEEGMVGMKVRVIA